jgi:hypothetical protein
MLLFCCCSLDLEQCHPLEGLPWEITASGSTPGENCVSATKFIVQAWSFKHWLYMFAVLVGFLWTTGLCSRASILLCRMLIYMNTVGRSISIQSSFHFFWEEIVASVQQQYFSA